MNVLIIHSYYCVGFIHIVEVSIEKADPLTMSCQLLKNT